ncbi:unnamed protein product [Ilex paraguariensis]|uniref:Uncharacterized protein n=1 Tax=Ilex paraguariensis TaxID=185542 RepID=A0ABC8RAK0_9AQUA
MTGDEEWVRAAMTDDSMVVELLVRLNQPPPTPKPALPVDWSVRQPRSKTMTVKAMTSTTTRASPTTPLSWSGAESLSGGAGGGSGSGGTVDGGFEESSRPLHKRSHTTRSKVTGTSETATTKRSRKKKTIAELKEEEILQLKEKRHLKREIANFHITLEKQRATNESLKIMKLDLQSQPAAESVLTVACEETISHQFQQKTADCDPAPPILPPIVTGNVLDALPTGLSQVHKEVTDPVAKCALPDLNVPFEEDSYGVS